GSTVAQGEVVLLGPAWIAMAGDVHGVDALFAHAAHVRLDAVARRLTQQVRVQVEVHRRDLAALGVRGRGRKSRAALDRRAALVATLFAIGAVVIRLAVARYIVAAARRTSLTGPAVRVLPTLLAQPVHAVLTLVAVLVAIAVRVLWTAARRSEPQEDEG